MIRPSNSSPPIPTTGSQRDMLLTAWVNYSESLEAFEKAIELKPNEASYYTAKASALAGLGRKDEALLTMARPLS